MRFSRLAMILRNSEYSSMVLSSHVPDSCVIELGGWGDVLTCELHKLQQLLHTQGLLDFWGIILGEDAYQLLSYRKSDEVADSLLASLTYLVH